MSNTYRQSSGFTLIEALLGLVLASVLITTAMSFYFHIQSVYIKNQVVSEVEGQGIQAMQVILYTIRSARSIVSPAPGETSDTLSLIVGNGALDQTIISVVDGTMQIVEQEAIPYDLTNERITTSNLQFSNVSSGTERTSIRVSYDLEHSRSQGRNELTYSKQFRSAASFINQ